jgi:uroporphyrinogen III methyltransferase/synthase
MVHLVGAGPGDPGLITAKGIDCLRRADVVVYDRLVNSRLLAEAAPGAEIIYAGKSPEGHTLTQDEINRVLVEKAKEGKRVVRLKGGDPFIFGRGGEEAEALVDSGIAFEVVPGVSSAYAAAAYAGIPVTHRDLTSSFAIVTGHEDPTKEESRVNWSALAQMGTLVMLMGMEHLSQISERLIAEGRSGDTPVGIVRWGTTPRQEAITGTLADIGDKVRAAGLSSPAVIVIGEVVGLREKLGWFENRPLFGKRVLVTRTRQQASALSESLMAEGAEPIELPTIEILPPEDFSEMDRAIENLPEYDWTIFTSANGVEFFLGRIYHLGFDVRRFANTSLCAIGPATSKALEKFGLRADWTPEDYISGSIVSGLAKKGIAGKRFLLPRADIAPAELAEGLKKHGAEVDSVTTYRTVRPRNGAFEVVECLHRGDIDVVTFTSSSTVKNLFDLLGDDAEHLSNSIIACIGPVTALTAEQKGLRVDVMAQEHTIPGLVSALKDHFSQT